uniref:Uncharacterized protein n=1 Tax=Rhizophora mucronata TaxID=61149 RepID=A0A2P2QUN6_RHIMU
MRETPKPKRRYFHLQLGGRRLSRRSKAMQKLTIGLSV